MTTIIFQKFVSRFAETFTLIERYDGNDYCTAEIVPSSAVSKLKEEDFEELLNELREAGNEKASWSDGDDAFDEEDARAAHHQKWDEINSFFDKMGM